MRNKKGILNKDRQCIMELMVNISNDREAHRHDSLSPEHQAEMQPLLSHQVPSKPVGGGVGQEDDTLGKTIASSVHIRLLQGRLIRSF